MSQKLPPLYVVSAARTAIGSFQGAFAGLSASELGAVAIKGALSRAKLDPSKVDEVFMGNVLTAAVGQAPARQAMIKAGIPNTTPATTVGKVCGSGLQSIVFGARALALGVHTLEGFLERGLEDPEVFDSLVVVEVEQRRRAVRTTQR